LAALFLLVQYLELCQVAEVVTLHFEVEYSAFWGFGVWYKVVVDDFQDVTADVLKLGLDLFSVVFDKAFVSVGFLFLDGGKDTPGGTATPDYVFVRNG